jgi:hypothetical protein
MIQQEVPHDRNPTGHSDPWILHQQLRGKDQQIRQLQNMKNGRASDIDNRYDIPMT